MKLSFIKHSLFAGMMALAFTACSNDDYDALASQENVGTEASLPDGYFRATFFPRPASSSATRAAVIGNSEQIQSLVCLIYKKQSDDSYKFVEEREILHYDGNVGNIVPQTYEWPLAQEVNFDLPKGDYRAVFIGNADKNLFADQKGNEILTNYSGLMDGARINMPELGPKAFNDFNMFYLCTVDFSPANPSPYVLLQRIMASHVFTRELIDTNDAVSMLVNNLVKQVRENNLTTDIVRALLHSAILDALTNATGLDVIAGSITMIVDRLVNMILGDVLEALNDLLLQEITKRVEAALHAEGGAGNSLLGLNSLLNPWTLVNTVDVSFAAMPRSIDLERNCRSYYGETTWSNLPLEKVSEIPGVTDGSVKQLSFVTLCGNNDLTAIDVDSQQFLLQSAITGLDGQALNGLLVNIHREIEYIANSNLRYTTPYELVNLTLSDFSEDSTGEPLELKLNLNDIVNLEEVVKQLLGDNILSSIVGGLTNNLLQPLLTALNNVVIKPLNIRLPGLNLNNIVIEGSWDSTYVSDGTIAPTTTK